MAQTFTLAPKTAALTEAGLPTAVWPTLYAITDHADNETGKCWPRMSTLAAKLGLSPRTVQRHVHRLAAAGFIEIDHRTRPNRGRFGAYVYTVVHIARIAADRAHRRADNRQRQRRSRMNKEGAPTTGHQSPPAQGPPNSRKTRRRDDNPPDPPVRGGRQEGCSDEIEPPPEAEGEALARKRSLVADVSAADGRDRANFFAAATAAAVEDGALVLLTRLQNYADYLSNKYPEAFARHNVRITSAGAYAAAREET